LFRQQKSSEQHPVIPNSGSSQYFIIARLDAVPDGQDPKSIFTERFFKRMVNDVRAAYAAKNNTALTSNVFLTEVEAREKLAVQREINAIFVVHQSPGSKIIEVNKIEKMILHPCYSSTIVVNPLFSLPVPTACATSFTPDIASKQTPSNKRQSAK